MGVGDNINFKIKALAPNGEDAPIYREMLDREVSYMKGIMMTSGMNKGRMLTYILNKTNRKFDAVIFVDDSQKNIDAVYAEFGNSGTMDMTIFHYTKIEDNRKTKNGAVLTSEQAIKMDNDWKKLNAVLNDIFPARKLQEGCLSKN